MVRIDGEYKRKAVDLKDQMDSIGKDNRSSGNTFAAILNSTLIFFRIKKSPNDIKLPEEEARAFKAKTDELVRVTQTRNRELSDLLMAISEKYPDLDSLPDVPLREERLSRLLGQLKYAIEPEGNSLPGTETATIRQTEKQKFSSVPGKPCSFQLR